MESKLLVLGIVIPPLMRNPYNGYTNPYYNKVDDHPYHRKKIPLNSEPKWRRIKVLQPLSCLRRFHVALNVASPLGDLSKLQLSISMDRTRCSTHPGIHAILSLHLSYRDEKVEVLQCTASVTERRKLRKPYTIQVNGLLDFQNKIMSGFWLLGKSEEANPLPDFGIPYTFLERQALHLGYSYHNKKTVNLPGPWLESQAFGWNLEAW